MVQSLRDLNIIVNHFERYPFLTKKREDFILFAQIVTLINKREHLTPLGLHYFPQSFYEFSSPFSITKDCFSGYYSGY